VPPLVLPGEVLLGIAALVLASTALRGTYLGLELKAIGRSPRAAALRGVPTARRLLGAFGACGALAGLAGFVLTSGAFTRHQLFPLISGGYGFLAILVVLLAGQSAVAALLVAFFVAAVSTGSLQLPLQMQLDSSLSGVIEAMLVLVILLVHGVQSRLAGRRRVGTSTSSP